MSAPRNANRIHFIGTASRLPTFAELQKTVTAQIGDYAYEICVPENFIFNDLVPKVKNRCCMAKEIYSQLTANISGYRYQNLFLRFLSAIRNWIFPAFVRMDQKIDKSNINSIRKYLFNAYMEQSNAL